MDLEQFGWIWSSIETRESIRANPSRALELTEHAYSFWSQTFFCSSLLYYRILAGSKVCVYQRILLNQSWHLSCIGIILYHTSFRSSLRRSLLRFGNRINDLYQSWHKFSSHFRSFVRSVTLSFVLSFFALTIVFVAIRGRSVSPHEAVRDGPTSK
jgi:hypothetical protein